MGLGGGGGGAIFARARNALVIPEGVTLNASGNNGFNDGGGGSGGAIFLAAPVVTGGAEAIVDLAGGAGATGGGDGADGRLRIDSPMGDLLFKTAGDSAPSFWLGAGIAPPEETIVNDTTLIVVGYGGHAHMNATPGQGLVRVFNRDAEGDEINELGLLPTPLGTLAVILEPGVNELCVETYRHDPTGDEPPIDEDELVALNCVEVGYIPMP